MSKQKTHKGISKRFKVTGKGKVKYRRPGNSHLSSHKPGSRVRHLRKHALVVGPYAAKIVHQLLPIA